MKTSLAVWMLVIIALMTACNAPKKNETKTDMWNMTIKPPVAAVKPHQRIVHGDTVTDNYYWMIDYFKQGPDSTEVVNYLKEENAYLDTMMTDSKSFREKLFQEMKGRIKEKDESVPVYKNGYYYYSRTDDGKQYFKYCRKKEHLDAPEEVLLDVDELAQDHPYFSVTGFNISDNNKLLAFGVDTVSRRQYTLYIKNLETGELYKDAIGGTTGSSVWASDNSTLFYTHNNPQTLLTEKIRRHILHTNANNDVTVYEEKDPSNYIGVGKTKSGRYIFISSQATLSSEMRFIKADEPRADFKVFQPRMKEVLYDVKDLGEKFYIVTNLNAKNFRLMVCPLNKTESTQWEEVIAHRPDVLIEYIDVFRNFLVVRERKNGLIQIRIRNISSGKEHYLHFEEPAYHASLGANPEFNSNTLRYIYTSMITPQTTYDYNMTSGEKKLMKQQEVLGGYHAEDYITERLYAPAGGGTMVPISIVYKKGFVKNGTAPLLLYGYGSYGVSMNATFNSSRLSLLNRGFAFAIAHIRGGEEMGRQWYEEGKLMNKKNSFTDFIDCGRYLIKENFTSPEHLYAQGGSAGGLLMGAVANMAPDLWNGIIAQVPFVDVVNTMLDASIPLTTNEYDEWGNPEADKAAYDYMRSYSPYENVEAKDYPNMLVTTGLHDSQVQYFEPAKWVAKLRATKTDRHVLLLHTNMDFGHGGASGRFDFLKDIALEYTFLLRLEGIVQH
ncbi:MAG TPA: S9 family peptidase [Agriterribacter sp.]|nr:S9 family peptidase [Agriterribacter sp.]